MALKIENIQDFKAFIEKNRENLYKRAVKIENLPPNDDWIQDDVWDEVWSIENGTIYIDYPDDHRYDTTIYEYHLDDRYFSGNLGDSYLHFKMSKIAGFDWSYYYTYDDYIYDYYYWPNSSYIWDDGDYYWSKTRKNKGTTPFTSTAEDNEREQIVKIGSNLGN